MWGTPRLFYKGIRTKEEHLAALKRSQTALASKIETQERKVSKMKEENKVCVCLPGFLGLFLEGKELTCEFKHAGLAEREGEATRDETRNGGVGEHCHQRGDQVRLSLLYSILLL